MGNRHRNRFSPVIWHTLRYPPYGSRQQTLHSSLLLRVLYLFVVSSYSTSMAAFTSTISINAEQLASSPQLEPSFEHLLRNSNVHESVIRTLRINAVTDRDTFVHMFGIEAALKDGASDLGFDLSAGGLQHKRNLLGLSQVGKQRRLWRRRNCRQML